MGDPNRPRPAPPGPWEGGLLAASRLKAETSFRPISTLPVPWPRCWDDLWPTCCSTFLRIMFSKTSFEVFSRLWRLEGKDGNARRVSHFPAHCLVAAAP